jgi:hypothetical protein
MTDLGIDLSSPDLIDRVTQKISHLTFATQRPIRRVRRQNSDSPAPFKSTRLSRGRPLLRLTWLMKEAEGRILHRVGLARLTAWLDRFTPLAIHRMVIHRCRPPKAGPLAFSSARSVWNLPF